MLPIFNTSVPRKKFDNWGLMELNLMLRNATRSDSPLASPKNEGEDIGEPMQEDSVEMTNTAVTELRFSAGLIDQAQVSQSVENLPEPQPSDETITAELSSEQDVSRSVPQDVEEPIHSEESVSLPNELAPQMGTTLIPPTVSSEERFSHHSSDAVQPGREQVSLGSETSAENVHAATALQESSEVSPLASSSRSNITLQGPISQPTSRLPGSSHTSRESMVSEMNNAREGIPLEIEVESQNTIESASPDENENTTSLPVMETSHGSESAKHPSGALQTALDSTVDEQDDPQRSHSREEPSPVDKAFNGTPETPELTSNRITSPHVIAQASPTTRIAAESIEAIEQSYATISGSPESLESVMLVEPSEKEGVGPTNLGVQESSTGLSRGMSQELVSIDSQNAIEGTNPDENENTTSFSVMETSGNDRMEIDIDTAENLTASKPGLESPKSEPVGNYTKGIDAKELDTSPMEEIASTRFDSIAVSSPPQEAEVGRATEELEVRKMVSDIRDSKVKSTDNESTAIETLDNRSTDASDGAVNAVETAALSPSITNNKSNIMYTDSTDTQNASSLHEQRVGELTTKPASAVSLIDEQSDIVLQAKDNGGLSTQPSTMADDRLLKFPLQTEKGNESAAMQDTGNIHTQNSGFEDQDSQTLLPKDNLPLPTIAPEPANTTIVRPRLKIITKSSTAQWVQKLSSSNDSNDRHALTKGGNVQYMPPDRQSSKSPWAAPIPKPQPTVTQGKRRLRSRPTVEIRGRRDSPVPATLINSLSRSQSDISLTTTSPSVASREASPLSAVSTNSRPIKFKLKFKDSFSESPRSTKRRKLSKFESRRSSNTSISETREREMLDCIVVRLDFENVSISHSCKSNGQAPENAGPDSHNEHILRELQTF